jgi:hypothetical protein
MGRPWLVLDNSVLSAFANAGWFHGPQVWDAEYQLVTSRRIWESEFLPYHPVENTPEWLSIHEIDLEDAHAEIPNKLSLHDWSGVIAAERPERSVLTTNDFAMKKTAERRDIETLWGTAFAIQTYQKCGISVDEFDIGVDEYISDVTLGPDIATELRNTQKEP